MKNWQSIIRRIEKQRAERKKLYGTRTPVYQIVEFRQAIKELHDLGMSSTEIGDKLSRDHTTIIHHLSKMGLSEKKVKQKKEVGRPRMSHGLKNLGKDGRVYGRTYHELIANEYGLEKPKQMMRLDNGCDCFL